MPSRAASLMRSFTALPEPAWRRAPIAGDDRSKRVRNGVAASNGRQPRPMKVRRNALLLDRESRPARHPTSVTRGRSLWVPSSPRAAMAAGRIAGLRKRFLWSSRPGRPTGQVGHQLWTNEPGRAFRPSIFGLKLMPLRVDPAMVLFFFFHPFVLKIVSLTPLKKSCSSASSAAARVSHECPRSRSSSKRAPGIFFRQSGVPAGGALSWRPPPSPGGL